MIPLPEAWRAYGRILDRLERLSQAMLDAVRRAAWNDLPALDQQRAALIRDAAMPPGDPGPEVTRVLRDRLQTILLLNERLLRLTESQCRDLSRQIHRLSAGRVALRAYADNSG